MENLAKKIIKRNKILQKINKIENKDQSQMEKTINNNNKKLILNKKKTIILICEKKKLFIIV